MPGHRKLVDTGVGEGGRGQRKGVQSFCPKFDRLPYLDISWDISWELKQ